MNRPLLLSVVITAILLSFNNAAAFGEDIACKNGKASEIIDPTPYFIKYDGKSLDLRIGNAVGLTIGDKQQQIMSEAQQCLNTSIKILVDIYNVCGMSKKQLLARMDVLTQYQQKGADIENLAKTIEDLKKNRGSDLRISEHLSKLEQELKSMAGSVKTVENQLSDLHAQIRIETSKDLAAAKAEIEEELRRNKSDSDGELKLIQEKLNQRIYELEKQFQYIMLLHDEGKLDKSVVSLGIGPFYPRLGGHWRTGVLLSGEVLYPKTDDYLSKIATIIDAGYVDWRETYSYPTLPSLPNQTEPINYSFYFMDFGVKKYIPITDNLHGYIGFVFGPTLQHGENIRPVGLYEGIVGVELYPWKIKSALELRFGRITVSQKQVEFNPFGSATFPKEDKTEDFFSMSLTVSAIAW